MWEKKTHVDSTHKTGKVEDQYCTWNWVQTVSTILSGERICKGTVQGRDLLCDLAEHCSSQLHPWASLHWSVSPPPWVIQEGRTAVKHCSGYWGWWEGSAVSQAQAQQNITHIEHLLPSVKCHVSPLQAQLLVFLFLFKICIIAGMWMKSESVSHSVVSSSLRSHGL